MIKLLYICVVKTHNKVCKLGNDCNIIDIVFPKYTACQCIYVLKDIKIKDEFIHAHSSILQLKHAEMVQRYIYTK